MATDIPADHSLRRLFGLLTEKSFTEQLGWPDVSITGYVSNLLVEFTHMDWVFRTRNKEGARVEYVADLLYESEVLMQAGSLERERDVHQHIGDVTLFMAGLFPEYLRRIRTAGLIYHKDFLIDYIKTGKRSYGVVAQIDEAESRRPLFQKLSDHFELCVTGLGFIRSELDRMKDPAFRRAKDLLLN